jgi:hypothetical protein
VFTKAFLNTLHENQGIMEGTKLFQRLRELVVYNADQTPEYEPIEKAGHEGGILFLCGGLDTNCA